MSPLIQPDLSTAIDMGPIEAGTYPAEIKNVEAKLSKKQNPMLELDIDVTVKSGEKPRSRKAFLVITGEGAYNFGQLLRATHFDDLAEKYATPGGEKPPFDSDQLKGQKLNVIIDHQIYNGEKRDFIKSFLRA